MTKKSRIKSQKKSKHDTQTVVNFYNHGTVNIDARQNNSRALKHENKGCTINNSDSVTSKNEQEGLLVLSEKAFVAAAYQFVEFMTSEINIKDKI